MRRLLEYQADQIELVLASHHVPARVTGGLVTPRWIRFELAAALEARVSQISNLSEELALRLGSRNCRVSRQGGTIQVEVPREDPGTVSLLPLCRRLPQIPPYSAVLGLDEEGTPLLLCLAAPDVAHVLIAGTTGSGKTALARAMALSLALANRQARVQLLLVDPKGRGLGPLAGLPHLLRPVVSQVDEAMAALRDLGREMERRDRLGISEPRIIVFIDELADLLQGMGEARLAPTLTRLLARGREAGIHVVGCTQKPTAACIGGLVKANFPVRLVGSVASPEDAKVAAGIRATGAEKLLGRGDFLLVAHGEVVRFQAAFVSPKEIVTAIEELRRNGHDVAQLPAARTAA
jgi:S-DNA-T family DNA segregation ATPase FtsK/SpoIIIE